ncbi:MAG: PAS domain S-box protein, partial [Candidatus Cloacimonetes bacterium]|nr:PAS domain S-box protein [Candidatus Cloacimonadota bacterium]
RLSLKKMTNILKEKDKFNSTIMDSTQAGVLLLDAETHIVEYANPMATEMIGTYKGNIIGQVCNKFFHPYMEKECQILDKGFSIEKAEKTLLTANGDEYSILITVKPIKIGDKKQLIMTFIDITEIKQLQKQIAISEKKYRTMFKASPACLLVTNEKGVIVEINNKVKKWLGYDSEEIIGKKVLNLPFLDKNAKRRIIEELRLSPNSETSSDYEIEFIAKDGSIQIGLVFIDQLKIDEKVFGEIITILNVTKQHKIEDEIKASNEELERKTEFLEKNRIELNKKNATLTEAREELIKRAEMLKNSSKYKSEFLANMSHELKSPLNSLLILSNNLAKNKKANLTEKEVESAKIINRSGRHLLHLINEILDLSKIEAGKMEIHPAQLYIEDFKSNITRNYSQLCEERNLELRFSQSDDFPELFISDCQHLDQIIKNLFLNSLKFTSSGYIAINFFKPTEQIDLSRSMLDYRKAIAISVVDTGIGIEKLGAIFESFQQEDGSTSRKYGGIGLGLSIARALTKLLGGEIQLESKVGVGSTFTVYLPEVITLDKDLKISNPSQKNIDQAKTSVALEGGENEISSKTKGIIKPQNEIGAILIDDDRGKQLMGKNILIVDDDIRNIFTVMGVLEEYHMNVFTASNGQEAIDLLLYANSKIDLVLLDMMMPIMDGFEAMKKIRKTKKLKDIPILAFTDDNMRGDEEKCLEAGANDCLTKPIDISRLFTIILECLHDK